MITYSKLKNNKSEKKCKKYEILTATFKIIW